MSMPAILPTDISLSLDRLANDQAVSEKHAAAILGLSVSKLQKDRVRGDGPRFIKNGKTKFARVTYRLGDLRAYQRENMHASTSTYLAIDGDALAVGLSLLRPFAVTDGRVGDFLETLDDEPDEIIWLTQEEAGQWRRR